jgi:hypothetical protein
VFFTIYKTTNTINDKIYVGMHRTLDLNDSYLGSGMYLRQAIKKYGIENFKKEILHVFDNEETMVTKEREIVNEEFMNSKSTYNACIGGHGGGIRKNAILSKQTKDKISQSVKKFHDANFGCYRGIPKPPLSLETKSKLKAMRQDLVWISRDAQTKMVHEKDLSMHLEAGWVTGRAIIPHNKGKGKPKIRKTEEELFQNRSNAQRGKKRSAESVKKTTEKNSKEYVITTPNGETLRIRNLREFCRNNDLKSPTMCAVLRGAQTHHKGYKIRLPD